MTYLILLIPLKWLYKNVCSEQQQYQHQKGRPAKAGGPTAAWTQETTGTTARAGTSAIAGTPATEGMPENVTNV